MPYSNIPVDATGSLSVNLEDNTADVLTVPMLKNRTVATLNADTVVGSSTISCTTGHGILVGEIIELAKVGRFMQAAVLASTTNIVTLDSPVNAIYPSGDSVVVASDNINVDGSVTPVVFSVLPSPIQKGDMVRMILEIRGTADMDFSKFGSIAALTKGCVLRVKRGDGTFKNLFNFKDCGDIIEQAFDHNFQPNNGGGVRGFTSRITWGGAEKHGAVIRLDGALFEELQLVVQDNLTGLSRFHITLQGHEVA